MANKSSNTKRTLLIVLVLLVALGGVYWFFTKNKDQKNTKSAEDLWREKNAVENTEGIDRNLAPDFTLSSTQGEEISVSQYKDKKAVILSFWTTWCPDCKDVLASEQKLYSEYKDRVEVLAVNIGEEESIAKKFAIEHKLEFPVLLDKESNTLSLYGVSYANMHILITKDGRIARVVFGEITKDHFEELVLR